MSIAGLVIGTWYLAILAMMVRRTGNTAQHGLVPAITVAVIGIATITACTLRLLVRVHLANAEADKRFFLRRSTTDD